MITITVLRLFSSSSSWAHADIRLDLFSSLSCPHYFSSHDIFPGSLYFTFCASAKVNRCDVIIFDVPLFIFHRFSPITISLFFHCGMIRQTWSPRIIYMDVCLVRLRGGDVV
ncbi:hypothetical protein BDN70DRAFT_484698 [Pholiota conissans]|uniref:Uncharacterized protein n=1 Tax=Pholiota conissans TaxID=109636 RepID=A0A9P6D301_9AGAR|nr:hypothetical protein BDN70DRAFT_484698 [Pholiota conissans]